MVLEIVPRGGVLPPEENPKRLPQWVMRILVILVVGPGVALGIAMMVATGLVVLMGMGR